MSANCGIIYALQLAPDAVHANLSPTYLPANIPANTENSGKKNEAALLDSYYGRVGIVLLLSPLTHLFKKNKNQLVKV
jgi:hypothetical protein